MYYVHEYILLHTLHSINTYIRISLCQCVPYVYMVPPAMLVLNYLCVSIFMNYNNQTFSVQITNKLVNILPTIYLRKTKKPIDAYVTYHFNFAIYSFIFLWLCRTRSIVLSLMFRSIHRMYVMSSMAVYRTLQLLVH